MASARRVIIDTDPGIDDAQAILFAFFSGEFQVEAVTTVFGNVDVATATENALRLVEMAGRPDVPVYAGAAEPLVQRRLHYAPGVHGTNGFGEYELPLARTRPAPGYAAVELARRVVAEPGEITILALGPLTNLALAHRLEPRFAASVQRVIFMGGIVSGPGNVSPFATANVLNDAEGAKVVFNAGARFTQVGQDVTRWVRVSDERRERMGALSGDVARFLFEITGFYNRAYRPERIPGFPVHDLLVMAYAARPNLFETRMLHVDVDTESSLTCGMTVADLRHLSSTTPGEQPPSAEANVNVCLKADADGILDWYEQVITEACRSSATPAAAGAFCCK